MIEVRETDSYVAWFKSLRDVEARARILMRVRRIALGNLGDVEPVGDGVSELRIHYGPGYRVYLLSKGLSVVILLGGGDKSSQRRDIAAAKALAKKLKG
jgi:putative addiction module killer protein